jgi:hypothetical protein
VTLSTSVEEVHDHDNTTIKHYKVHWFVRNSHHWLQGFRIEFPYQSGPYSLKLRGQLGVDLD